MLASRGPGIVVRRASFGRRWSELIVRQRLPDRLNLALQGGGAHKGFTWGALARLLEADLRIMAAAARPARAPGRRRPRRLGAIAAMLDYRGSGASILPAAPRRAG